MIGFSKSNFIRILLFFICLGINIFSQTVVNVIAEGSCAIANITPEEARRRAIEIARAEAIKQAVGLKITEETFRTISDNTSSNLSNIYDSFSRLSKSTSSGKIIAESLLEDKPQLTGDQMIHFIKLSAEVVKEEENIDLDFTAEIILSREDFYVRKNPGDNDEINFKIWVSKDSFVYLFNLMSTDSVQLLIPNKYITNNFYSTAKDEQEFERLLKNVNMQVSLQKNVNNTVEALYLVALKDKIDFKSSVLSAPGSGLIPTYKAAFTDIQNWLVQIPSNRRTEVIKQYNIKRL